MRESEGGLSAREHTPARVEDLCAGCGQVLEYGRWHWQPAEAEGSWYHWGCLPKDERASAAINRAKGGTP